ncbi:TolB family protein [Sphaerisporangium perillae]|uniref:TolB family protein n=1 Tax=Sphaerisporangium perillae TaxID=2935860 RepID=UPI0020103904|nr:hypothetical protein [Sphaerisporangium perillae]
MNDLEDTLRRTLGHASEQAPKAPTGLPAFVAARSRRREMRTQALVAAVAVAAVTCGVAVTVRGAGGEAAPVAVNPTTAPSIATGTPPPAEEESLPMPDRVEKVWPQAVRTIPATLPDGRAFNALRFIDDHTLLIETQSGFEKADAIYAYDLDGGGARKIADVPIPAKTVLFPADFSIGEDQVVWWTARKTGGTETADLWAVPLSGGEARLVASYEHGESGSLDPVLAVSGDKIAFSFRSGGVFTVPLGGGTVEPVAGSEKDHILSWPWVGSGGAFGDGDAFVEVVNVETGERRTATVNPGERRVRCGLTLCTGEKAADGTGFYRLRDGTQEKRLPGFAPMSGLAAERFHSTTFIASGRVRGVVLHDLATGRSGDLGIRPEVRDGGSSMMSPDVRRGDGRLFDYPLDGKIVIIDFSKIS